MLRYAGKAALAGGGRQGHSHASLTQGLERIRLMAIACNNPIKTRRLVTSSAASAPEPLLQARCGLAR